MEQLICQMSDSGEKAQKKRLNLSVALLGGEYRIRTDDLLHAMQAL